jgi:hypothetical protein
MSKHPRGEFKTRVGWRGEQLKQEQNAAATANRPEHSGEIHGQWSNRRDSWSSKPVGVQGFRRIESRLTGVNSGCHATPCTIFVLNPLVATDFPEKVPIFCGCSPKVLPPVAARPDHTVVGPPLFFCGSGQS